METGGRRLAGPEQMVALEKNLTRSDGKVCQGHAVASQATRPTLSGSRSPLPRHQLGGHWIEMNANHWHEEGNIS